MVLRNGALQGVEIRDEVLIGRADTNTIILDGELISRSHARIVRRGNEYAISDLNSKNGIVINGRREQMRILRAGDEIRVGQHILYFDPSQEMLATILSGLPPASSPTIPQPQTAQPANRPTMRVPTVGDNALQHLEFFGEAANLRFEPDKASPTELQAFAHDVIRFHSNLEAVGSAPPTVEGVCDRFACALHMTLAADRLTIILRHADGSLRVGAVYPDGSSLPVSSVVLRAALRHKQALLVNCVGMSDQFRRSAASHRDGIKSAIAFPILTAGKPLGVVYADTLERLDAFQMHHLQILRFAATELSLAIEQMKRQSHVTEIAAQDLSDDDRAALSDLQASFLSGTKRRSRRIAAMATLARRAVLAAVPAIAEHLADRDTMVASAAETALNTYAEHLRGAPSYSAFVQTLLGAMDTENPALRQKLCEVVYAMRPWQSPLRDIIETFAHAADTPAAARAAALRLLNPASGAKPESEADVTWMVTPANSPSKPPDGLSALEKRRAHFQAREAWLKNNKQGPEPREQ